MEKIEKLKRETVLIVERNKCVSKLTKLEIEIAIISRMPATETVEQKDPKAGIMQKITAGMVLDNMKVNQQAQSLRFSIIEKLLADKKDY